MSEKTILVIDDSATIRRLVDSELGNAGYRVVLAPNAEDGLQMAGEVNPDLILLDHQLPGTTGYDVCCKLLEDANLSTIPVVISSTLRKKAYVEYMDCSNVIDMLPKPYTGDLLQTTVANAIDTASMVVQSQSDGSAVPEVIEAGAEGDLSGSFENFSLREIIDLLTNGEKCGRLEVDLGRRRVSFFLGQGRIQAVTGSGFDPQDVVASFPAALADLAPMIKFTLRNRNCNEIDGLVDLLNNKVLDARLLRQLLRHQAAVLLNECYRQPPISFRFEANKEPSSLFVKLPLDLSLLSLTVESAQIDPLEEISEQALQEVLYVRAPKRGQNLDRAGLSAEQMNLLNLVANPTCLADLLANSESNAEQAQRIMKGFVRAEIVDQQIDKDSTKMIAVTGCDQRGQQLNEFLNVNDAYSGRTVSSPLAVKLLLRRMKPDLLLFDLNDQAAVAAIAQLRREQHPQLSESVWLGISVDPQSVGPEVSSQLNRVVGWPGHAHQLAEVLSSAMDANSSESPACAVLDFANP